MQIVVKIGARGARYEGQEDALLDTRSAGSIMAADRLAEIGLTYLPDDEVHRIRGVGGVEFVFTNSVDRLTVGELN